MNNEEPKITCVERLYKVEGRYATYFVKAKTELSQDVTEKLLQEDMELKTFLANYEITNINLPYRSNSEDKSVKIRIGGIKDKSLEEQPYKKPFLAGKLNLTQRLYIIKNELPEWFSMKDFMNAVEAKDYSPEDAYKMWKSTWNFLSKNKKIERTKGNTSSRKYKYIKDMSSKDITEKELKSLKEGNKIVLGAIQ